MATPDTGAGHSAGPGAAYNRVMLHTLQRMFGPAVLARVTLMANHVIGSEAVATQRLLPHAGKRVLIELRDWPSLLPPLPPLAWQVTPAGLLDWCGPEPVGATELRLSLPAENPALLGLRLAQGQLPEVDISGDAQLATDVNWLMQNLRWDLADDLERVFPAPVAQGLHRAGTALVAAVRSAVQTAASARDRWQARSGV
jgi:ubiquinone biosynthesis accessory factor UbiJ